MTKIADFFRAFVNGISRSRISVIGSIMTTIILPVLLVSVTLDMQGVIKNPYFGFLIYMVMGPMCVIGVICIFAGVFLFKGNEDIGLFAIEYLKEQFNLPGRFTRIRRLMFLAAFLTLFTIFLVGIIAYTGFHYTESVSFCGQFCHSVMEPEYVTYQNSPHSRVSCVKCHIGEDSQWFTKAKISGARQLLATALNNYERPIMTPIGGLRPMREVCEQCHRPEMFHGDKLYVKDKFLPDEQNTHLQTVMVMKVGAGGYLGHDAQGIHWHVSPTHKIYYTYNDQAREDISKIKLIDHDGSESVFARKDNSADKEGAQEREMDCMDCHNRPTHIYLAPEEALDRKMVSNEIPAEIPYIKRQALAAITGKYHTVNQARQEISSKLRSWYKEHYPEFIGGKAELLEQAINGASKAYAENVFPEMGVLWRTYRNFIGHEGGSGCFRCHDEEHYSADGKVISKDCQLCHIILVEDEPALDITELLKNRKHGP
ncbi:MAG: NapC/NirT family cytochrome c [Proteobacteria bacterium]|nr:NapC/NirT family cytochrome c [Pseudomonadota bacterium]MBU1717019.1 NapC/NirT family cytochrome c [Pseudomonadota bacterium]